MPTDTTDRSNECEAPGRYLARAATWWVAASMLVVAACGSDPDGEPVLEADGVDSVDMASDAGPSNCRGTNSSESCRLRSGCRWLELTCDTGGVAAGCVAEGRTGELPFGCGVGGSDAGRDATPTDAAVDCSRYSSSASCRARPECRWWSRQCGGDVREACVRRDEVPEEPTCPHGDVQPSSDTSGGETSSDTGVSTDTAVTGECSSVETSTTCRESSQCRWWEPECDGGGAEGECLAEDESLPDDPCDGDDRGMCHENVDEETCGGPDCGWVVAGCGGGYDETSKLDGCLPAGTCESDADCPSDHRCEELWVDPCHDSACTACGERESRCVPTAMLE